MTACSLPHAHALRTGSEFTNPARTTQLVLGFLPICRGSSLAYIIWHMKTNLALLFIAFALALSGQQKNTTCNSIEMGNTTYTTCSDGTSLTSQRLGNTTFHNDNRGNSGSTQRVGNTSFTNWSDGSSSTSQRLGNTTFHNTNHGEFGGSTRIGNTTFHSWSDGSTGATTKVGNTTYTNIQLSKSKRNDKQ